MLQIIIMNAVTFCEQLGSRGDEIASGVAETLGWRLVHRDLVNQAAIRAGAPEIALAEIDEFGFFRLRLQAEVRRAYLHEMELLMRDIAAQGQVVFLCPGGHIMLRQTPGVLHVCVVAPYEHRLAWLKAKEKISEQAAAARLLVSDQARARRLRRDYGVNWQNWEGYHLIINSALLGVPAAISLVTQTLESGILQFGL